MLFALMQTTAAVKNVKGINVIHQRVFDVLQNF